ncbi:MAG: site-2 protease family protein [Candidatus Undinarchaeales archaeon]
MITIHAKVAVVLALIIVGYVYFRNTKGKGPVLLHKTKHFIKFIDRLANLSKTFWNIFFSIGVVFGFFFMAFIFLSLFSNAAFIASTPGAGEGVMLALPGITIPFIGPIIALIILVFVHEFSHGIMARVEGVKIKSVGVALLGFLPIGAFVDPSEKEIQKLKPFKRLKIFAAGPFSNIVLAVLLLIVLSFAFIPAFTTSFEGVKLTKVESDMPAEDYGLEEGIIINKVNGEKVDDIIQFSSKLNELGLEPGDSVRLSTDSTTYNVKTIEKNGGAYIGIHFCSQLSGGKIAKLFALMGPGIFLKQSLINPECYPVKYGSASVFWFIFGVLKWTILLNYAIGLINLLPVKPLDGGLMVETVVNKFVENKKLAANIVYAISFFGLLILLVNLIGPSAWQALGSLG